MSSLASNPCAKDIYRILADNKKNGGAGVDLEEIEKQLLTKYEVTNITTKIAEMKFFGVVEQHWAKGADRRWRMVYEIGRCTEWSALFATTLGYDAEALGISAYAVNQ